MSALRRTRGGGSQVDRDTEAYGMSRNSADPLCGLVAEVLNLPADAVDDDSSPETTDTWDSIAGMSLVVLIEETYRVAFEASELARFTSVGAIRGVLRDKGVPV